MNRRIVLSVGAATALGLGLLSGGAIAQQKSLKDQLVGTWTAVSWVQTRPDGSKLERFGAPPKGINVFEPSGRFFLMYARPDLPKIAANNPSTATPEEAKAILAGSYRLFRHVHGG